MKRYAMLQAAAGVLIDNPNPYNVGSTQNVTQLLFGSDLSITGLVDRTRV